MDKIDLLGELFENISQESGAERLSSYLAAGAIQISHPTNLFPTGSRREGDEIVNAWVRGAATLGAQRYEIISHLEEDDRVALELEWSATLLVPLLGREAGSRLHSTSAFFCSFELGKLRTLTSFDSYF